MFCHPVARRRYFSDGKSESISASRLTTHLYICQEISNLLAIAAVHHKLPLRVDRRVSITAEVDCAAYAG